MTNKSSVHPSQIHTKRELYERGREGWRATNTQHKDFKRAPLLKQGSQREKNVPKQFDLFLKLSSLYPKTQPRSYICTSLEITTSIHYASQLLMAFNYISLLFLAFILIISPLVSPPIYQPVHEATLPPLGVQHDNKQVFHITKPMPYRRSDALSQMLPKGFVPPSDSSACHNNVPDSVSVDVFCRDGRQYFP